jgi:hypothetical protein
MSNHRMTIEAQMTQPKTLTNAASLRFLIPNPSSIPDPGNSKLVDQKLPACQPHALPYLPERLGLMRQCGAHISAWRVYQKTRFGPYFRRALSTPGDPKPQGPNPKAQYKQDASPNAPRERTAAVFSLGLGAWTLGLHSNPRSSPS